MRNANSVGRKREAHDIEVRRLPTGKSVVSVSGEVTFDAPPRLVQIVVAELMRAPSPLVLDLSAVTLIGDAGLDALVSVASAAGELDISFCLVGIEGRAVGAALAAAELTELFEVFSSVNDAS